MRILTENEIQEAIKRCGPREIAVAYIGSDWGEFISNPSILDAVIISPTIGTNPRAVTDLAKKIGWEKIFFLNELHAKIYLGQKAAVVGSANLTHNGLSGQSLVELCVEVNGETGVNKIKRILDDLRRRAQDQYPTTETKKAQIKDLEKAWSVAITNRILPKEHGEQHMFSDFEVLAKDHFYVCWWNGRADYECSNDIKAMESVIEDYLPFAQSDNVEKNKWALTWRITESSIPHKTAKLEWMYIHDVFDGGIIDKGYEYPRLAIQRKDMEIPSKPFEITKEVEAAFKKVVVEKDVAKHLIQADRVFSLEHSLEGMPILINRMKKLMANKENAADANAKKRRDRLVSSP